MAAKLSPGAIWGGEENGRFPYAVGFTGSATCLLKLGGARVLPQPGLREELTVATLKRNGEYDQYRELIDILVRTESAKLARLVDMDDLLKKVQQSGGTK